MGDPLAPVRRKKGGKTGAPGREGDSRAGWSCLTLGGMNRREGGNRKNAREKSTRGNDVRRRKVSNVVVLVETEQGHVRVLGYHVPKL